MKIEKELGVASELNLPLENRAQDIVAPIG